MQGWVRDLSFDQDKCLTLNHIQLRGSATIWNHWGYTILHFLLGETAVVNSRYTRIVRDSSLDRHATGGYDEDGNRSRTALR